LKDTQRGLTPLYHGAYVVGFYALLRAQAQQVDCVVLTTIDRAMARAGRWVVGAVTTLVRPGQMEERLSYGGIGATVIRQVGQRLAHRVSRRRRKDRS
jgi:hypothetical protein